MTSSYKHLISLGYNCGAAYQIRLHTLIAEAHFFDWLFTSIQAASSLIETDFESVLDRENLEIVRNGQEVLDKASGIRLNHSFKHKGVGLVDRALMERDYERERDKFRYMAAKFKNVLNSGDPVAFVRYNPYPAHLDGIDAVKRLANIIHLRSPNAHLYWITNTTPDATPHQPDELFTHVCICEDPARSISWNGRDFIGTDDIAWKQALSAIPIDLVGRKRDAADLVLSNH